MLVNVVFAFDFDVLDVPCVIAKNLKKYQLQCDKWLFDKNNNHEFRIEQDSNKKYAINTCSEAFVFYLNNYVLTDSNENTVIIEKDKRIDFLDKSLPTIYY